MQGLWIRWPTCLPAKRDGNCFEFKAFGEECRITPEGIWLGGDKQEAALCYIFYEADDDFPASVKCLYSSNARLFLAVDALADVGEYTSKKIISLLS